VAFTGAIAHIGRAERLGRLPIRLVLALVMLLLAPLAARAAPVDAGRVTLELVAQDAAATPGATVYVALRQQMDPGWHTYWRNPGDSGEPTRIVWTLPQGWRAGDIVWPAPQRISTGPADNPILNYVFSGQVLLPVPITVPANARPGETVTLRAHAAYLVCAEICVPEEADVTLFVPVAAHGAGPDPQWGAQIARTLAAAPKASGLTATYQMTPQGLRLGVTGAALQGADLTGADFFAYTSATVAPRAPRSIERGPGGLTFTLAPQVGSNPAQLPAELSGVLSLRSGAVEVTARPGPIAAAAIGLGQVNTAAAAPAGLGGLALNLAWALLGGMILNLMPCVFPVLSMKAAALAGHGQEARGARLQGLVFMAGCVATFLALAGLLIAARAAGQAVGWGFQLQDPRTIAVLALILFGVGLNLSGVFEIGASVQGAGSALASRAGLAGSFFTGALAVVVAAPCTAPFMATAIGYAATQPPAVSLAVFAALGIGFALPFTALAFAPALWRRLPRPGPWMTRLRQVLAFPMYAAAAWLVWVLTQQAGPEGLARVLVLLLLAAVAAYALGWSQASGGRRGGVVLAGAAALIVVAAVAGAVWPGYPNASATAATTGRTADTHAVLPSQPFSPAALAAARASGRPVFVNFTAAWCVTCQVNERAALSGRQVADAFARTGAVYMVGDWTRRDAVIAAALSEHGRDGVPLYLVYPAGGGEPRVLPQLLTGGMVAEALDRARGSSGLLSATFTPPAAAAR
jgi:thiol:disulfide interchange protein DsbD